MIGALGRGGGAPAERSGGTSTSAATGAALYGAHESFLVTRNFR